MAHTPTHSPVAPDLSEVLSYESLFDLNGFQPDALPERRSVETQTTLSFSDNVQRTCMSCDRVFVSNKGMKQHQAKAHSSTAKLEKCTVCSKSFKDKYAVKFHLRQVHSSTRVMCPICLKWVYNKYMLQKHFKNQHLVVKA
jgi:uncharacterized Zn-finger protein